MNRKVTCILLLLTIAPVIVSFTLVCLDPARWGGDFNPITIINMGLFGLFTIPLWPTYIPALIFTPIVMNQIVKSKYFRTARLTILLGVTFFIGALAGAFVMLPLIILSHNIVQVAVNWAIAGAVSGSITLCAIILVYRRGAVIP
jgi:hypothetical protein